MRLVVCLMRVVLVLGLGVAAAAAPAQEVSALARFLAAADEFDRMAVASPGAPPHRNDPEFADAFRVLTNAEDLLREEPATSETLEQLIARASGVASHYLQAGTRPGQSSPEDVARAEQVALSYQDEITPLMVFLVDVAAALVESTNEIAGRTDFTMAEDPRAGLLDMRRGWEQTLTSMIMMATLEGVNPENRLALVRVVARHGSVFASGLSLSQRQAVILRARTARPQLGAEARRQLDLLVDALTASPCQHLCAI